MPSIDKNNNSSSSKSLVIPPIVSTGVPLKPRAERLHSSGSSHSHHHPTSQNANSKTAAVMLNSAAAVAPADAPPLHTRQDSGSGNNPQSVHVTKFLQGAGGNSPLATQQAPVLARPSQPSPNRGITSGNTVSLRQRNSSPSAAAGTTAADDPHSASRNNSHHKDSAHSSAGRAENNADHLAGSKQSVNLITAVAETASAGSSANANANTNTNGCSNASSSSTSNANANASLVGHADQSLVVTERLATALRVAVNTNNVDAINQDEAALLDSFHSHFQSRVSGQQPVAVQKLMVEIFQLLTRNRLASPIWLDKASPRHILSAFCCARILLRDPQLQASHVHLDATSSLCNYLERTTNAYLAKYDEEDELVPRILIELINIVHRLSRNTEQQAALLQAGVHKSLLQLLAANNLQILHVLLATLAKFAELKPFRAAISEFDFVDILLRILQDYDDHSRGLAAVFLLQMLSEPRIRHMVKYYDGIRTILSLLDSDNIELLLQLIWCVLFLAKDLEGSQEVGDIGGIPILLSLLHDRNIQPDEADQASSSNSSTNNAALFVAQHHHKDSVSSLSSPTADELQLSLRLKCTACTAMAELLINDKNDSNAHQLVRNNGIYLVSLLILPSQSANGADLSPSSPTAGNGSGNSASTAGQENSVENQIGLLPFVLQCSAIRILRVLFSLERNRRYFKKLFPPRLYETFIDIGHYVREITAYHEIVHQINALPREQQEVVRGEIQNLNHNREATHQMNDYSVYELLGQGAFGSVYKVKKHSGGSFLAMKEIYINSVIGKSSMKERDKTVCDIISELTIIREQLRHPNVVRYYKTFVDGDKIYIVMEYIEGAPLAEYFTSYKEKNQRLEEERVWRIFVQIVLALRYLHKDKRIVHRDLTPNNIMLGDDDKVTITDFGLAKQKNKETSKLNSVVGTLLYWCPELVQSLPYGEKADVWAAGCILYQLATLQPPFYHTNLLTLGKKIAEADYEPIDDKYSEKMKNVVSSCLTVNPEERPDIVGVASLIADLILRQMDTLKVQHAVSQKRLERERRRAQKHMQDSGRQTTDVCAVCACTLQRTLSSTSVVLCQPPSLNSSAGAMTMREDASFSTNSYGVNSLSSTGIFNAAVNGKPPPMPSNNSRVATRRSHSQFGSIVPQAVSNSSKDSRRSDSTIDQQLRVEIPPGGAQSPASKLPPSASSSMNRSASPANANAIGAASNLGNSSVASNSGLYLSKMMRSRSNSSNIDAPTLTISAKKVRQIHDPVLEILRIAQKLIYITQLPPSIEATFNARRRVIERYKRALFAPLTRPADLKSELHKLMTGVCEPVELNLGADVQLLLAASEKADEGLSMLNRAAVLEQDAKTINVDTLASAEFDADVHSQLTYEQLLSMIDATLRESGYYEQCASSQRAMSQKAALNRLKSYPSSTPSLSGSSNDAQAPTNGHSNSNPSPLASTNTSQANAANVGPHTKQKALNMPRS